MYNHFIQRHALARLYSINFPSWIPKDSQTSIMCLSVFHQLNNYPHAFPYRPLFSHYPLESETRKKAPSFLLPSKIPFNYNSYTRLVPPNTNPRSFEQNTTLHWYNMFPFIRNNSNKMHTRTINSATRITFNSNASIPAPGPPQSEKQTNSSRSSWYGGRISGGQRV